MGQESFIYSFVARGTMILAEYTEFTGNFPSIAAQCLHKLPSSTNSKFTYNCDHHTFNFLVEEGYAYCVVAKDSLSKQISIAFLERVKADFKKRYGGGKASTAIAKSLNKEFGPVMKEHMKYIVDHAEEIEKLIKVKAQVSEVKSIMLENIDKKSPSSETPLIKKLTLKVKNQQGEEDIYKLGSHAHLKKLMTAYCQKRNLEYGSVRFLFNNKLLKPRQTPAQLKMEEDDEICLVMELGGGGPYVA